MNLAELAPSAQEYLQIDEDGYFRLGEERLADAETGAEWLAGVRIDHRCRAVLARPGAPGEAAEAIIEAFDEPYVALSLERRPGALWSATMPYGFRASFALSSLSVDEWDRFHARAQNGVPMVFSRAAQAAFFDQVDAFDDDSATCDGQRFAIGPWLAASTAYDRPETWNELYRGESQGWELGTASSALAALVPRLKLPKCRILLLGAGTGNDAAFFAQLGHLVTAVDFSAEAIARARQKYEGAPGLRFVQADAFALPESMAAAFDIVVEHTCYCAVSPSRRNELVRAWRRALVEGGHLLGVFFTIDKRDGPPFGSSEWELRERFGTLFRPLYWLRSRHSQEKRKGQETLIYAQKLATL
jgi:SAM-dependent methyltransferase